ncbi:MAG: hypothetical protein KBT35_01385 [Firmicutes bacterium]|nr:hypothetical protein [Candidatus Colivicinus equi]
MEDKYGYLMCAINTLSTYAGETGRLNTEDLDQMTNSLRSSVWELKSLEKERDDWQESYALLLKQKVKLDKALDMACDYVARVMPLEVNEIVGVDYLYTKDRKKMKEYFLQESEKQ